MNKCLSLVVMSLIAASCQNKTDNMEVFHPYDEAILQQAQEIKINHVDFDFEEYRNSEYYEKGVFKFSDVFSKVEYVKLESSEDAYLGTIQKMFVTEDDEFIFFDQNNRAILRFAANGKFLNRIGVCGHAQNEYIHPYYVQYDQKSRLVYVADREQKCIKVYSKDGKYVRTINIGYFVGDFGIIDDNNIAVFSGFWGFHKPGETAYPIKIHDYDGNLIAQYAPYTFENKDYSITNNNAHVNVNGKLICNEQWSSLVYTFEGAKPKPLYNLNFGDKQIPQNMIKNATTPKTIYDWQRENDCIRCDLFFDNPHYIIMQLIEDGSFITYIQNKKDPNHPVIKLRGTNDMNGLAETNVFVHAQNDKMYFLLEPFDLQHQAELLEINPEYMKKAHGDIKDADIALLKDLSKNNNYVIQICTLK